VKFLVEITETLQRRVEVEAENEADAELVVRERYRNGEIVLAGDDYVETVFNIS